ncbi:MULTISPECIES: hypothetical protein [unclassified Roseateles]|uniref:hypothetical protein n=1 Tax=unclassified Roseateles TaxID=2626991 RepID=UPI0007009385|nr:MULTISPECIES: hypothetical protein [unclassified Roseateles]KQW45491.1 hypothetical protein ASC81_11310 [Pelomonas sp. Root405]KRA72335.1 hypothetical protein ASD88_11310 [Pelomonas sp. Root662]
MNTTTAGDLDALLLRDEQLKALALPVWILFGVTVAAVLGMLVQKPVLGVVGWVGGWFIGPWVISRAAPLLGTPAVVKYPLFLACALPVLSLAAPTYVWLNMRPARAELETKIRQAEVRERRRAAAPAGAAATPATPRAPTLEALPVLRGVAHGSWAEGDEVKLQISGPLPPGMTADAEMPPTRATGGVFAVGYHVDAGSHWTSVNRDDLRDAGLSLNALHRQALANLMKRVKGQPGMRLVEHPPYYGLLLDGDHEACLVLLDGLWDHLFMDKTPNGAVVAIPSRDVLAFCDANSHEGLAALREVCARIGPDAQGAVFQGLLRRRDGRWTVMD